MMMPHMHEESMERFISHVIRISGNGRVVYQNNLKNGLRKQERRLAWSFMVVSARATVRTLKCTNQNLYGLNFLPELNEGSSILAYADVGRRERRCGA